MAQKSKENEQGQWLGGAPAAEMPESRSAFPSGALWVGQHAADHDTLVFDPAESDPEAERLSLYSLTQHRMRTFPRSVVLEQIHKIVDEVGWQRAIGDYHDREARRQDFETAEAAARTERVERQRQGVIEAHGRYLAAIGVESQGVEPTPDAYKPGRRMKCAACGIVLDDFAGTICRVCEKTLCSCGVCACTAESAGLALSKGTA